MRALQRPPAAGSELFVYGSLTFPEVLQVVLGRVPRMRPVRVAGFRAAALQARPFPGLVEAEGSVAGTALVGLSVGELALLDDYEGPMYGLVDVEVDDGTRVSTYVCRDTGLVEPHDWDRERFATAHLAGYVERIASWRSAR